MLPPDDDFQDGTPGPESEPGEAAIQAVLARVPADFYKRVAPLLQLCAVGNFLLLGRPRDPVPQAIAQLTGFDLAAAARVSRLRDSASLGALLLKEPETLYDFLLVGQLVFESQLFNEVRALLAGPDADDANTDEVAQSLRAFVVELSEAILSSLSYYLTQDDSGQEQDLNLRQLQLQSIFARLADTLVPVQLPYAADSVSRSAASAESQVQLRIGLPPLQLAALQLALRLPEQLQAGPRQTFARAVANLFQPRRTAGFMQRLQALAPHEELHLNKKELGLLYQAAQLCAWALVNGLLDEISFSTLAPRRTSSPTGLPDLCAELERFVQLVQTTFPHEPALVAARSEVEALAKLL